MPVPGRMIGRIALIAAFILWALLVNVQPARATDDPCVVRALEDIGYEKKGDIFSVTVYDPGDRRTSDQFSGHGSGWYPAHIFKAGKWVASLQLTSYCKIGGPYGDDKTDGWLAVEEIRSKMPPLRVKYMDAQSRLLKDLCDACAPAPAKFYVYKPQSPCGKDVARFFSGDKKALQRIEGSECAWQTFQSSYPNWVDPEPPPPFDNVSSAPPPPADPVADAAFTVTAPDTGSALDFMRFLYVPYTHDRGSYLGDVRWGPQAFEQVLDPSLAALWSKYFSKQRDGVGPIDGDPICSCQEPDVTSLRLDVRPAGTDRAVGHAKFKLGVGARVITFALVRVDGDWRIHDIKDKDDPKSLRVVLEEDNS